MVSRLICGPWAFAVLLMTTPSFAARPFTIQDLLQTEDIGRGAADPQGHLMLWEQSRPYNRQSDYSVGLTGTWSVGSFQLMAVALDRPAATPHPLFSPDPGRSYWFDSFSPDCRISWLRTGRFPQLRTT